MDDDFGEALKAGEMPLYLAGDIDHDIVVLYRWFFPADQYRFPVFITHDCVWQKALCAISPQRVLDHIRVRFIADLNEYLVPSGCGLLGDAADRGHHIDAASLG